VLLAGDGDFLKAIHTVNDKLGKTVHIAGFHGSVSTDLQQFGRMIWLEEMSQVVGKRDADGTNGAHSDLNHIMSSHDTNAHIIAVNKVNCVDIDLAGGGNKGYVKSDNPVDDNYADIRVPAIKVLSDIIARLDCFSQTIQRHSVLSDASLLIEYTTTVKEIVQEEDKLEEHIPLYGIHVEAKETFSDLVISEQWLLLLFYVALTKAKLSAMISEFSKYSEISQLKPACRAIVDFRKSLISLT